MRLLRSAVLLLLVMVLMVSTAVYIGTQQPPTAVLAYMQWLPNNRYQLVLYDVETRYALPLRVLDNVTLLRWLEGGGGLAVSMGLGQYLNVYEFDAGWSLKNSGVQFATRSHLHSPEGTQLVFRQNENNLQEWNVFAVQQSDRSEQPIPVLQNLSGSPSLHWSPSERHLILFLYDTNVITMEYLDWRTTDRHAIRVFPASNEMTDIYYSPDERWAAVVTQISQTHFELYILDLTTLEMWRVSNIITENSVAGFLPQ